MPRICPNFTTPLAALALAAALAGCAAQHAASPAAGRAADVASQAFVVQGSDDEGELMRFVPGQTRLHLSVRGDLDQDGDEDALIVMDDGQAGSPDAPRSLRLLRRDADGRLQVAIDSPRAIPCRRCGGMMGDPLQGIRVEPGGFVLRFEGGSRALWSSEFRFVHAPASGGWRLADVRHVALDRADGRGAERVLSAEEIGVVSLARFDASAFPADALE